MIRHSKNSALSDLKKAGCLACYCMLEVEDKWLEVHAKFLD
jgi:hypothetical protein